MPESYETRLDEDAPPVRELSKAQRRLLGVLVEKAFTTPDQYPLTLKAATSGANQKSNRDPVANYSENAVWDALDQLRELGLVAVVHPESGRTERFRHYMRKRFPFSEPQLAIMTELMLRGRQQLGELRSRASRMVSIESLDELRRELTGLQELGYVQASGSLERRGIEVDHTLYTNDEKNRLPEMLTPTVSETPEIFPDESKALPGAIAVDHSQEISQLREEVESLRNTVEELKDDLSDLRRSLGA